MNDTLFNNPYNLYQPANDTSDVKAFNSDVSFCNTAHEVLKEQREAQNAAIARMIAKTKEEICE